MAYTWSKALGIGGQIFGLPGVGHLTNTREAGYGPLGIDRTQVLTFNYIYDIPSLARRGSMLDNRAGKLVFDGWQFSGLSTFSSGAPTNVTYSISGVDPQTLNRRITGSEDVAPRVVLTCNPNVSHGDRTIDAFINTSCFAPAAKGSIGIDSGNNRITGPGINQWNMSLFKKVNFTEKAYAQLRLEAFNAYQPAQPVGGHRRPVRIRRAELDTWLAAHSPGRSQILLLAQRHARLQFGHRSLTSASKWRQIDCSESACCCESYRNRSVLPESCRPSLAPRWS